MKTMAKTRTYAGSEKCEIASSDVVFGISNNNMYNDCMSINITEANQSEMRNEFQYKRQTHVLQIGRLKNIQLKTDIVSLNTPSFTYFKRFAIKKEKFLTRI